jgi:hypothetical protein
MMRSHALTIALALIGLALSMPLFELEERLQENFEIDSQAWLRGSGARRTVGGRLASRDPALTRVRLGQITA